jgi:hypothetical protein
MSRPDSAEVGTYRYLRLGIPLLVLLLGASLVHRIFLAEPDCWLGSISAYYYTAVRSVFVAALCAIGACLIINRGNTDREDIALNLAGFLAFFVAFIPTPLSGPNPVATETEPGCGRSNVPTEAQLAAGIDNNIAALLVAAVACLVVAWWFWIRSDRDDAVFTRALLVASLLVGGLVVLFNVDPDLLRRYGHLVSAVGVFVGIGVVVAMNAFTLAKLNPEGVAAPPGYQKAYRLILAAMVSLLVVLGATALMDKLDHVVFWLEAGEIGLFAIFWLLQTLELPDVVRRGD